MQCTFFFFTNYIQDIFFNFAFQIFDCNIPGCFCEFMLFLLCWASQICHFMSFPKFGTFLAIISSDLFFCTSLISLEDSSDVNVGPSDTVPWIPDAVFLSFIFLRLFVSIPHIGRLDHFCQFNSKFTELPLSSPFCCSVHPRCWFVCLSDFR